VREPARAQPANNLPLLHVALPVNVNGPASTKMSYNVVDDIALKNGRPLMRIPRELQQGRDVHRGQRLQLDRRGQRLRHAGSDLPPDADEDRPGATSPIPVKLITVVVRQSGTTAVLVREQGTFGSETGG
jgi:hypothetical protein